MSATMTAPAGAVDAGHKLPKFLKFALFLWFVLIGITMTQPEGGGGGIASRLAPGDVWLLFTGLPLGLVFAWRREGLMLPRAAVVMMALLAWFAVGIPTSLNAFATLFEWVVNVYAFTGFIVVYSIMRSLSQEERLDLMRLAVIGATIIAVLGLYDFMAAISGLPRISEKSGGAVTGTFRNTGQAGHFFMAASALALPYAMAESGRRRILAWALLSIIVLTCLLTIKRASIIGLLAGFSFFVLFAPSIGDFFRRLGGIGLAAAAVYFLGSNLLSVDEGLAWRIDSKVTGNAAASRISDFAEENQRVIFEALDINPITGVGLGGVYKELGDHEVHSGYFGILVTSGIIGLFLFGLFIVDICTMLLKPGSPHPLAKPFGRIYIAMFLGMAVSWIYTYPVRKREFWAFTAVAVGFLAPLPSRRQDEAPVPVPARLRI